VLFIIQLKEGVVTILTIFHIGRKIISSIISAVILSLILVLFHAYAPFFIYFLYSFIGCLLIGIPCSLITDMIIIKMKINKTMLGMLTGLVLHLICAGIILYLFSLTETEGFLFLIEYASAFVYSVFIAATGLWLVDTILKKIQFPG